MSEEKYFEDRIAEYLIPKIKSDYIFDELSDNYLERANITDILKGVPVPIKRTDFENMSTVGIARNMAFVMGSDINFKYRENYREYILRTFTKEFVMPLLNEGVDLAAKGEYLDACVMFRAAIILEPENKDAFYCYGRALRDAYENGDGEEFIGKFKAESLEAFEKLTLKAPEFDMGFYFLGFAYINLGLYLKSKLTWDRFMELSGDAKLRKEVQELLNKLDDPCKIEEGYNCILSGRFEEGIAILSDYEEDIRFNNWWPLWFYLGVAYNHLDMPREAEKKLTKSLALSPSNVEVMEELVKTYEKSDNLEMIKKYQNKIKIVKENAELDREIAREEKIPGLS